MSYDLYFYGQGEFISPTSGTGGFRGQNSFFSVNGGAGQQTGWDGDVDGDGLLLGRFFVPVAPKGLSFVGVTFQNKMVTRVRIVLGNAVIGTQDDPANGRNVVVADDFLYGEPTSDCVLN